MKKIIIALAIILGGTSLYSQDAPTPKLFHFGLKVAPTLAWMKANVKELKNEGMKLGFAYGLMTEFGFTNNYAFVTGLDIAYRGGKMKYETIDTANVPYYSNNNTYKLQFIEIPLTLKMKTNQIGPMIYFGQIGIAPGFAINTKGDVESSFETIKDSIVNIPAVANEDINSSVNKLSVSMIVSLGVEYNLGGSTNLLAAVTFNNGFTNILKDVEMTDLSGGVTTYNQKAASNYLALTIGILF